MHPADIHYHLSGLGQYLETARLRYYQLILLAGQSWEERTALLECLAEQSGFAYIALGSALSRALLDSAPPDRPVKVEEVVDQFIAERSEAGIVVDQIEILFDPDFKTDPLRLLQACARWQPLVASWPGGYNNQRLTYAAPSHPEYYSQPVSDLLVYTI